MKEDVAHCSQYDNHNQYVRLHSWPVKVGGIVSKILCILNRDHHQEKRRDHPATKLTFHSGNIVNDYDGIPPPTQHNANLLVIVFFCTEVLKYFWDLEKAKAISVVA